MHPTPTADPTHRRPTTPPGAPLQLAALVAPAVALWAVANPAAALLVATLLAALAWHRRVAGPRGPPRPTGPPL